MIKSDIKLPRALMHGLTIVLTVVTGTMAAMTAHATPDIPEDYGQPENLGAPVRGVTALDSAYGVEDGRDVLYTTVSGIPAAFEVVDLETYKVLRTFPLPGGTSSWSHEVDKDGNVYVGVSGKLFRYLPSEKSMEDLGDVPGAGALYDLSIDEVGNVYMGTYPKGSVVRWNVQSRTYDDLGQVASGKDYVRGLELDGHTLYAGTGPVGTLWKMNLNSGEKEEIPFPVVEGFSDGLPFVMGLQKAGDYLFANIDHRLLLIYDTVKGEWVDTHIRNYKGIYSPPVRDNEMWFMAGGKLHKFDLETEEVSATNIAFPTFLRHAGWVDVSATNPDLPGVSLATVQFDGKISFMNLETEKVVTKDPILEGQPVEIQTLEKGPSDNLYISGYLTKYGSRYNIKTGEVHDYVLGQSEGMTSLGTTMIFGNYQWGVILEVEDGSDDDPIEVHKIGQGQDRPFAMTSGDGQVFVGTVAEYGKLDGALSIRDREGNWKTHVGIVDDQSVTGLAYRDGVVYGSSGVWGGLGSAPTQENAVVFKADATTGEKLLEMTPELPGKLPAKHIGQLTFGPDGLLWGAAWGTVFAMDPDTLEVVKSREVFPTDWKFGHMWRPIQMRWGDDGLLYTTLGRNLTVINPESLDHRVLAEKTELMTLGGDGYIYYAQGTELKRIALPANDSSDTESDSGAGPDESVTVPDEDESDSAPDEEGSEHESNKKETDEDTGDNADAEVPPALPGDTPKPGLPKTGN